MLGSFGGTYDACIGGYIFNNFGTEKQTARKVGRYQIGVSQVDGVECLELFSLQELYNEILQEQRYGKQEELALF